MLYIWQKKKTLEVTTIHFGISQNQNTFKIYCMV